MASSQRQIVGMRPGTKEHDTHPEALYREEDEELEKEFIAPKVLDDLLPTQASEESHIEHGSVVPEGVVNIHDGEHIEYDHGETEVSSEADLSIGDTVVAAELMRELGPFYVETETYGVEAISISTPDTSIPQGRSIIGGTLTEVDGFQAMGSSML